MPKVYLPLLLVLAILLSSPLLLTRDSWLAEESSKGPRGKGLESDAELICIPFSRVEEDVIGRFKLSTNITYRVGKTTVYTSLNISDLAFYSYAVVEHSEPADFAHRYYIEFLVERAVRGDFSEDVKWEIEVARRERGGYLDELVSWLDKNMSTDEMLKLSLERYDKEIEWLLTGAYRYGMLTVLRDKLIGKSPWNLRIKYSEHNIEENLLSARLEAEYYLEDLNKMRNYLELLVERAVRGDFSEDVKWEIEVARRERGGYLDELVSWLDKNMSTDEMVSRVLDRMDDDIGRLSFIHLEYYGAYQMLYLLSKNETYVITSCNPPFDPPQDNKWYYISNWQQAGRVWVGCYSSGEPDMHHFLGEFCTSTYTTNLNYYWNSA
ncbi:MAG: hypothetical protein QXJ39_05495, partial [Candidatus Korarchaeum sp.]